MSMTTTLRPAQEADIPEITAIYAHAVRHGTASWELDAPDAAEMGRRRAAILAGGYPYIVAEQRGTVLGYGYASSWRPRPGYRATVEDSLYIAPEAQRQGIGRLILTELISACTALGYRQMVAVLGDGHGAAHGSRRLHERLGFVPAGILREIGFKQGRWLDMVVMQRALGAGATQPLPDGPIRPLMPNSR
jgi:L-amino acid N-acyltransferase YncA